MSLEAKTCRRMSSCDFQEQIKRTGAYATPGEKPGVVLPSVLATAISVRADRILKSNAGPISDSGCTV